jgi:hypothetical protein
LFAENTSVLIYKDNYDDFQQTSNLVLSHMSKWFEENQLVLNMEKTSMLKFKTSNVPHRPLTIRYKQKYIKKIKSIKFLGIRIDSSLTWKNHIDRVIPKLSIVCYAVGTMYLIMNMGTLRIIYFGYYIRMYMDGWMDGWVDVCVCVMSFNSRCNPFIGFLVITTYLYRK